MRRSIDDYTATLATTPTGPDDELEPMAWAIAISDDYDDAEPRIVLTLDEVGRPAAGLVAHLPPDIARQLRVALRDALAEIGQPPGP